MKTRLSFALIAALVLPAAFAAPKAELWERWSRHDPAAKISVDHSAWDDFLRRYRVEQNGIALLRYAEAQSAGRDLLRGYLRLLAAAPIDDLNRDEQRAFWINLYNALTVDLILENHPVDSIRDIKPGLFSPGPWDIKLFSIGGEELSLNDIEHRILRPIWQDPRLHYAVNCASLGCPNLPAVAHTAANGESLLAAGARDYVNHPRGASVIDGRLRVSSIYEWFKEDFGGDDAGVIAHLRDHAAAPLAAALEGASVIADDAYDWSLNAPPLGEK